MKITKDKQRERRLYTENKGRTRNKVTLKTGPRFELTTGRQSRVVTKAELKRFGFWEMVFNEGGIQDIGRD